MNRSHCVWCSESTDDPMSDGTTSKPHEAGNAQEPWSDIVSAKRIADESEDESSRSVI